MKDAFSEPQRTAHLQPVQPPVQAPKVRRLYSEFEKHMRAFMAPHATKSHFLQRMLAKQEAARYQTEFVVVGVPDA